MRRRVARARSSPRIYCTNDSAVNELVNRLLTVGPRRVKCAVPKAFSRSQVMYAVIQTGGKQYRVEPGKTIEVEKLAGEAGTKVTFDQVLLVSSGDGAKVSVGKPL